MTLHYCPQCGRQIADTMLYCPHCQKLLRAQPPSLLQCVKRNGVQLLLTLLLGGICVAAYQMMHRLVFSRFVGDLLEGHWDELIGASLGIFVLFSVTLALSAVLKDLIGIRGKVAYYLVILLILFGSGLLLSVLLPAMVYRRGEISPESVAAYITMLRGFCMTAPLLAGAIYLSGLTKPMGRAWRHQLLCCGIFLVVAALMSLLLVVLFGMGANGNFGGIAAAAAALVAALRNSKS